MSPRFSVLIFSLIMWWTTAVLVVSGQHDHVDSHEQFVGESMILDPFKEISQASLLTVHKFESFIDKLLENLLCEEHEHEGDQSDSSDEHCEKVMCINAEDLIEQVGGNASEGITEEQFGKASMVLLYLITELNQHYCHTHVNVSLLSLNDVEANLLNLMHADDPDHPHIHTSGMKALLEECRASINHGAHDHDEEAGHDSHSTDEEHEESSDEDHDSDEDGEHDDDEDGEHDDHDRVNLVIKSRCLAPDTLLYYMGGESSEFIDSNRLAHLASYTVYFLSQGSDIQESCLLMPPKKAFIQNMFSNFDGNLTHMPIEGLEEIMTSLGINLEAHGDGDSHAGHDHRRKKRSSGAQPRLLSTRVKRQTTEDNQFRQCYSAEQLVALYNTGSYLDHSEFQQLCPSLVSQKLYGDCSFKEETHVSDAEKYGYSSLAVFIVCLCSILGVVLIPCASHKFYDGFMATFYGLAVGTLFADAVLHLIPNAFGVHGHEEGHDHGSEIVVEEFAQYGVVIVAALYFFYILELVMSSCGGHSHGGDEGNSMNHNGNGHINNIMMSHVSADEEKGKKYAVTDQQVEPNHNGTTTSQHGTSSRGFRGLSPVSFMIVIGDAIHNTADGLVIGASFSQSISTGIATSIAVFCHELPHELGDFAVLLQSGCSFGKAVFLNLLSSLTAFIGLYIGLSLSVDSTTERWIFAIASGMFIYIALVDLLPKLVNSRGLKIVFHNIGMLLGFGIMFLLVVFEEHIEV